MADDVYLIDVEVHFAQGDPIIEQVIEGQGIVSPSAISIDIGPGESVKYFIDGAVNYRKVTRRKLEPEVKPGWE